MVSLHYRESDLAQAGCHYLNMVGDRRAASDRLWPPLLVDGISICGRHHVDVRGPRMPGGRRRIVIAPSGDNHDVGTRDGRFRHLRNDPPDRLPAGIPGATLRLSDSNLRCRGAARPFSAVAAADNFPMNLAHAPSD